MVKETICTTKKLYYALFIGFMIVSSYLWSEILFMQPNHNCFQTQFFIIENRHGGTLNRKVCMTCANVFITKWTILPKQYQKRHPTLRSKIQMCQRKRWAVRNRNLCTHLYVLYLKQKTYVPSQIYQQCYGVKRDQSIIN